MIKNKVLDVKIIFKTYLKIGWKPNRTFVLQNIKRKTVLKNYFWILFLKTVMK